MNIFKLLKKLFKKYYFKKDIFSSPKILINKKHKNKKPNIKKLEIEKLYNEFYSSPSWKNYQQKLEMDIFLHRNKNIDILVTPLNRINRIKTIIEGILNNETTYNTEEWYEKNKNKLWKYVSRKK